MIRRVAIQQLRYLQAFLESVQKSIFWHSETMAHVYGIVLDANLRVVMEYFPLGPLDQYLRDHKFPVIDLVEAATNLAKALFYLVLYHNLIDRIFKLSLVL